MNLEIPAPKMSGRYTITIRRPDGSIRYENSFDNYITNAGIDYIFSSGNNGPFRYCHIGTGTTNFVPSQSTFVGSTVLVADSGLTPLGSYTANTSPPYEGSAIASYTFPQATADYNCGEIGVSWSGTPGTVLFSRAAILDSFGNPTTITILNEEILTVGYQIKIYPPLTDVVQTTSIGGVSTTVTTRAAKVTDPNSWAATLNSFWLLQSVNGYGGLYLCNGNSVIGSINSSPTNLFTTLYQSAVSLSPYTTGSYQGSFTYSLGINDGNSGANGIGCLVWSASFIGVYQVSFNPPIPKDNTKTLTLTFNYTASNGYSVVI